MLTTTAFSCSGDSSAADGGGHGAARQRDGRIGPLCVPGPLRRSAGGAAGRTVAAAATGTKPTRGGRRAGQRDGRQQEVPHLEKERQKLAAKNFTCCFVEFWKGHDLGGKFNWASIATLGNVDTLSLPASAVEFTIAGVLVYFLFSMRRAQLAEARSVYALSASEIWLRYETLPQALA